jgi:aminopeptidase YwaD
MFIRAALVSALALIAGCSSAMKSSRPPQNLVQKDRLMAGLKALPTSRAALGDEASRDGLRKTEVLLTKSLTNMGYKPTLQEFKWALPARNWPAPGAAPDAGSKQDLPAKESEHTWHNILVDLPGTDLPNEVLIIGAHFDAVLNCPGADDNGTGTAALLELARVLKDHPTHRTIRLIFFNLEECGVIGSGHYARSLRPAPEKPKETIIGMVSLEMLGYFSDAPNSQRSPIPPVKDVFEPPTVGDGIAMVGLKKDQAFIQSLSAGMKAGAPDLKQTVVDFLPIPIPDMMRSDHRPFIMMGIPGVMVTDTANFRNPNYHQPTDTVETIDQARYTLVVKALANAAYTIAEPATK